MLFREEIAFRIPLPFTAITAGSARCGAFPVGMRLRRHRRRAAEDFRRDLESKSSLLRNDKGHHKWGG